MTNSTDELGRKTWFVYDAAGRLLSQTNANNEVLQFTYNPADQMLTLKDGKNQTTTWNYDEYGRVTNKFELYAPTKAAMMPPIFTLAQLLGYER